MLLERRFLKHMHGFGQTSVVETTDPARAHHHWLIHMGHEQGRRLVRSLLTQFGSGCPQGCRVHLGEAAVRPGASVRVECDVGCLECGNPLFIERVHLKAIS